MISNVAYLDVDPACIGNALCYILGFYEETLPLCVMPLCLD